MYIIIASSVYNTRVIILTYHITIAVVDDKIQDHIFSKFAMFQDI